MNVARAHAHMLYSPVPAPFPPTRTVHSSHRICFLLSRGCSLVRKCSTQNNCSGSERNETRRLGTTVQPWTAAHLAAVCAVPQQEYNHHREGHRPLPSPPPLRVSTSSSRVADQPREVHAIGIVHVSTMLRSSNLIACLQAGVLWGTDKTHLHRKG